ncbi:MAG: hypothetical protein ACREPK_03325 [Rhodanobacteraceae bacterium]
MDMEFSYKNPSAMALSPGREHALVDNLMSSSLQGNRMAASTPCSGAGRRECSASNAEIWRDKPKTGLAARSFHSA